VTDCEFKFWWALRCAAPIIGIALGFLLISLIGR